MDLIREFFFGGWARMIVLLALLAAVIWICWVLHYTR